MLAVKNADGTDAERYAYDKAGNMVKKMILRAGRAVSTKPSQSEDYQTTTFTFDGANQLVSSTTDGMTTKYAYDAAGRLVKEGAKTYRYGYLDKVLSVTDGKIKYTYTYHADGQLAKATVGGDHRAPRIPQQTEDFLWDGLALIQRGGERFINEPHIGGGNPVVSSKGTSYFNDVLGTTLGSKTKGTKYSAAALTAFGESMSADSSNSQLSTPNSQTFYTGKPHVAGLGHAFLFRNYCAGLAKWQTADPMGYLDGWNRLTYCGNISTSYVDLSGGHKIHPVGNSTNRYGFSAPSGKSEIILGHWWMIDAECNGNPRNLSISFSIVETEDSLASFNAPFSYANECVDNEARYFNFTATSKNVNRDEWVQGGVAHAVVEFDLVMCYQVTFKYRYLDNAGEEHIGTATQNKVLPTEHILLECQHRLPE